MKYLYALGSLLILAGALGKIQHWPYHNTLLLAGIVLCASGVYFHLNSVTKGKQL